jgi:CheY-like chemotaxis protein
VERYVLVVDDFADGREMLSEYLSFRGVEVVTAGDGAEAIEIARQRPPAVILMDLSMPGIDGWEATRRLKADGAMHSTIIVAVTAHALAPDEGIARAAGCDAFVAKPYQLTVLGDAVLAMVERGRAALKTLDGHTPGET